MRNGQLRTGRTVAAVGALSLLAASAASAAVVFNEQFNSISVTTVAPTRVYTSATPSPNGYSYTVNTGVTPSSEGSIGNSAPSLKIEDTSATLGFSGGKSFNTDVSAFNMSQTGQEVLKVRFDLRVDSFTSTSAQQNFHVTLTDSGRTDQYFVAGLGKATIGGVDKLAFYGGSSTGTALTPSAGNAVLAIGNWSTTAGDNNTGSAFYRFEMTFTKDATTVAATVTNLANTSLTASTNLNVGTAYSFSSGTGVTDAIRMYSPTNGTGVAYFDNIVLESAAIPEPASLGLLTLGALGLRRRRRH